MRNRFTLLPVGAALLLLLTSCASSVPIENTSQEPAPTVELEGTNITTTFLGQEDGFFYSRLCIGSEAHLLVQDGSGVTDIRTEASDSACAR